MGLSERKWRKRAILVDYSVRVSKSLSRGKSSLLEELDTLDTQSESEGRKFILLLLSLSSRLNAGSIQYSCVLSLSTSALLQHGMHARKGQVSMHSSRRFLMSLSGMTLFMLDVTSHTSVNDVIP